MKTNTCPTLVLRKASTLEKRPNSQYEGSSLDQVSYAGTASGPKYEGKPVLKITYLMNSQNLTCKTNFFSVPTLSCVARFFGLSGHGFLTGTLAVLDTKNMENAITNVWTHQLNYMCLEFDHFGQILDKCQTNVRQIPYKKCHIFMSYHHHMSICFSVRVLSISFLQCQIRLHISQCHMYHHRQSTTIFCCVLCQAYIPWCLSFV